MEKNIGFSPSGWELTITIPSFLSFLINIIFIIYYIIKLLIQKKKKEKTKMSSIETLLLFLSLIEGSISFLWFYNGIKYPNESKIIDESTKDCNLGCKIIGTI